MAGNFTEVQIANKALYRLAAEPVESEDNSVARITSTTIEAEIVQAIFGIIRDSVLEDRVWSFALRRVLLDTPEVIEPVFGFSQRFVIPADALHIWRVHRDVYDDERLIFNEQWILEDQHILVDLDQVFVQYITRLDSENIYKASPLFVDALSLRLAAEMCIPLTENRTLHNDLLAEYQQRLQDASSVDGGQATREIIRANSFINIRNSSFPTGAGGAFSVGSTSSGDS